ncbi:F-box domain-containing protein [Mycena venus]|uniref:F-box domain-containing protein n=1 Tax=Mycena venus TaxID=2733690 RepID=A0A8H6XS49_9AGAR|nr:F-box domain-containing protein [Mycena venus]
MSSLLRHQCEAIASSGDRAQVKDLPACPPPGTRHDILLNSNEAPLDSDVPVIQSEISNADAHLECLATEIARLHDYAHLNQIEEDHISLSTYRARNKAILSPLRRIPPEVLGEIFSWTIPSLNECWERERFRMADSPWLLTHVSRRWRAAAIANPSLWSFVAISYQSNIDPTWAYPLSMVQTQLERAQKLNILFGGCETTDYRPQVDIFQSLAEYSSRWEELTLHLTSHLVPLLARLRDRVPLLRTFWIQWDEEKSQEGVGSIDCFQDAPALVKVGICNEYRPITCPLPQYQLTHYDVDGPWEVHRDIIRHSPNLVEASVKILPDVPADEPLSDSNSGEIINLLFLRRLFVSHPDILEFLRFPALEEISIDVNREGDSAIPTNLKLSIARSASLRRLCLNGCPDAHGTMEILEKFPLIIELAIIIDTLVCSSNAVTLMQLLTGSDTVGSNVVAPQLASLAFACTDEGWVHHAVYLEMVTSRWSADRRALKSVSLLTNSGPSPDSATIVGLSKLRDDGLDLLLLEGEDAENVMDKWLCCSLESLKL